MICRDRRRLLAALACAGPAAMLGAACARRRDDAVVRFWAMGSEGEVVTRLLPAFERANPGIRVDVQQLPDGSVLVSDEQNGAIYRVTYGSGKAASK